MEFIDYVSIGTGLLLIVVGWLCYRNPNLINPYGGMSLERKALVDIEGLKRALAIILTIAGGIMIVVAVLGAFDVIDELTSAWVLTTIALVMIIPMFIAMKKYNGFGRDETGKTPWRSGMASATSKAVWVIIGLSMVFVAVLYVMSSHIKITVGEESVKITSMYGRDIPVSEIVSVELIEKLPSMQRTNGSDTGRYLTGHFKLKNGEKCMVYVRYDMPPYIELRTTEGLYFFNGASKEMTLELYAKVKEKMNMKQSVASHHCEERSNPGSKLLPWMVSSCLLAMTGSPNRHINL